MSSQWYGQHGAEPPNAGQIPVVTSILKDFSAEALGELRTWLEQNPPAISVQSIIGYQQQTQSTRVHLNANQSIADATATTAAFDTVDYDYGALWDTTNKRFNVGLAGKYVVGCCVSFAGSATGNRVCQIRRGTGGAAPSVILIGETQANLGAGATVDLPLVTSYDLAVRDTLDVRVAQTSGGALNLLAGVVTNFWIVRVGP